LGYYYLLHKYLSLNIKYCWTYRNLVKSLNIGVMISSTRIYDAAFWQLLVCLMLQLL